MEIPKGGNPESSKWVSAKPTKFAKPSKAVERAERKAKEQIAEQNEKISKSNLKEVSLGWHRQMKHNPEGRIQVSKEIAPVSAEVNAVSKDIFKNVGEIGSTTSLKKHNITS